MLFATGNGPWDGKTAWGDALIMLDSNATEMLGNWTTTNNAALNAADLDMGSTSPVLLGDGYIAQRRKADGTIRLLTMDIIKRRRAPPGRGVAGGRYARKGTAAFRLRHTAKINGKTYLFASQAGRGGAGGTTAWTFGADHKLTEAWKNNMGGNTPFVAGNGIHLR